MRAARRRFPAVRSLATLAACAGVALTSPYALAGSQELPAILVDGIAAVVNDEVISIGEVQRAALLLREAGADRPAGGCGGLGARAMSSGVTSAADAAELPTEALDTARECLIDGTLVYREARRFPQLDVTRADVNAAYRRLQESFPDRDTFRAELDRLGLTPEGVLRDLRRQLLVTAYIETRFRATVDVDESEARAYYSEELVPGMQEEGIAPPAYEEVAEEYVLPILREREVRRRVESWLEDLRARATIRRLYP